MKTQVIVKELEEVARQLGLGVRKGKGNFKGGRCVVAGDELIVLNKHHVPEMHLSVLAEGLRDQPVDGIEMKPAVRKALEAAWGSKDASDKEEEAASASAEADNAQENSAQSSEDEADSDNSAQPSEPVDES